MFEALPILIWIILFTVLYFVLWLMHRSGIKRKGFPITKQNLSVIQEKEMRLNLPYEQAFAVCKETLNKLPRINLKEENQSRGILVANTQISWESFGEKIGLDIQTVNNSMTKVKFRSRPLIRTTMFDYGKSLANIERIKNCLIPYAV